MKRPIIILLAAGIIFATFTMVVASRRAARQAQIAAWEKAKAERAAELARASNEKNRPAPPTLTSNTRKAPSLSLPAPPPATNSKTNISTPPLAAATPPLQPGSKKAPLQDPLARVALSLTGADPDAEEIWVEAINNPDLPAKERQDLIEDLNEEGFSDPKNLTPEDVPLILSRLALIEEHAPKAMDEVNYAAFMEAYKDLVNMLARLTRQ